jgi:4-azaleucine resistance transporter AzlC
MILLDYTAAKEISMDQANVTLPSTYAKSYFFRKGCWAGLSIAIGYFPIAVTFGLLAVQQGQLNLWEAALMSMWVYAGASQYIAIELIGAGVTAIEIILATFILNLRHFLMSTVLSQQLKTSRLNSFLAFGITDETFAVATISEAKEKDEPSYFAGIMLTAYASWVLGTIVGVISAGWIPDPLRQSMGIALYAMFIGLLIPSVRKSWRIAVIALLGALISWIGSLFLSAGWAIVAATLTATTISMLLFRKFKRKVEGR